MAEKRIHLIEEDYTKLSVIIRAKQQKNKCDEPHLKMMAEELEKAVIMPEGMLPSNIASIGSKLRYRAESTGEEKIITLVMPVDADYDEGKISVFAPLGAALVGETVGAEVECHSPAGTQGLKLLEVMPSEKGVQTA